MRRTVVVVGGGYAGIAVAKALDEVADVVLVEPRDTFVHNVAALRGLVDPAWTDRMFLPYDGLLDGGRVVRDRAVRVTSTAVICESGASIAADYVVLATGSGYPYPAKMRVDDSAAAKAELHATREALAAADRVLLLGAGPVGLELAGEIRAAYADKAVTILDRSADIASGDHPEEFRAELRRQLDAADIELVLGDSLLEDPPSQPGEAKTFTATTRSGRSLTTDIWFRCFGVTPATGYLDEDLASARRADGHLEVSGDLRLRGQRNVFALGDITAIPEPKQAGVAAVHAEVVAANVRALLDGEETLTTYEPGPAGLVLPLGPDGGATHAPGWDDYLDPETVAVIRKRATEHEHALLERDILGARTTAEIKGATLMLGDYAGLLGLPEPT